MYNTSLQLKKFAMYFLLSKKFLLSFIVNTQDKLQQQLSIINHEQQASKLNRYVVCGSTTVGHVSSHCMNRQTDEVFPVVGKACVSVSVVCNGVNLSKGPMSVDSTI